MIIVAYLHLIFLFLFIAFVEKSNGYTVTQECYKRKSNSSFKSSYCIRPEKWIDKFDRLDTDGDGVISFAEYYNEDACFIDNLAHWFCGIDLDENQYLGADEIRRAFLHRVPAIKYFNVFDTNDDARLSYWEVVAYLQSENVSTQNIFSYMNYSETVNLNKFIALYNTIPNPTFPVVCSLFPCLQLTQSQLQLFQSADKNKDNWISFDELIFSQESQDRMRKEFDFLGNSNRFKDFDVEPMKDEEEEEDRRWWDIFGWFSKRKEKKVQEPVTVYYVTRDQWMSMGTNGEVFYTVLYQDTFDMYDTNSDSFIDVSEFKTYLRFRNLERRNAWQYIRINGKLNLIDFVTFSKRVPNIKFQYLADLFPTDSKESKSWKFSDLFNWF